MNKFIAAGLAAVFAAGSSNVALADQPAADWMPAQQVIEKVLNAGYTQVTKLEVDDGRWEGEGMKNGQKMEFHADPRTGVINFEKPDD
ncbi:PepSY domain-containing protein [Bradyrhizobium sp. CB3481]|uniref:PepSY domain-containing protein n=1 Tax=Bradyrhizobium sp. CB3481 TaxID=3039158 RepID=UPI0024B1C6F2|nr:PepSY domain-containing protein [Bradyrhizobium sp. CB3481]WFU20063.1 PepSY domain-containing protein [Bradyrhizobium sp. CB3481]